MFPKIFSIKNPKGVIGINRRNVELIYANNRRKDYQLADDKVQTKEILHQHNIACADTYAVINKISEIQIAWNACKKHKALAIKPSHGFGGGGILIVKKNEANNWIKGEKVISERDIIQHITCIVSGMYSRGDSDSCLIEECIIPHSFFAEIYDEGVPDFRIITLKSVPVMAMLRMPTSVSGGMANLHQNGVGIGIDMQKGILTQVYDGKRYSNHHPDNPNIITGLPIPFWDRMLKLSIDTANVFPLDYLGIDIVIDKNKGPQIMEINVRPGLAIQMVNQSGLKNEIEKYCDSILTKTAIYNEQAIAAYNSWSTL